MSLGKCQDITTSQESSSRMIAAGLQWIVPQLSAQDKTSSCSGSHMGLGKMGRINVRTVSTIGTLNNYVVSNYKPSHDLQDLDLRDVVDQKFER